MHVYVYLVLTVFSSESSLVLSSESSLVLSSSLITGVATFLSSLDLAAVEA